jgi:hypothetical protein
MTVTLTPQGQALLEAALARGLGASPEEVVERALEAVTNRNDLPRLPLSEEELERRRKAVEGILEFRRKHKLSLGPGLTIKDLINEGRKY